MGCVYSILSGAMSKIGELSMESIIELWGYLTDHDQKMDKLKEEHEILKCMKEVLQRRVDVEKRNGLEISPIVNAWLHKVGEIEIEIERFYEDIERNMDRKCLGGWCPDLESYYSLGREIAKRMADIVSLKEEKLDPISYPTPPPSLGTTFTQGMDFESRKEIVAEIMEKLKDEKIQRISICGMGGVGKTTLVKEVIKMIESNKLFDEVAMAVVSQNPTYEDIQNQIADRLRLKWTNASVQGRAEQLLQRLKGSKRVLIVLDDVWKKLDFELIGLASCEGCRIIFTSRNEQVCDQMGSQQNFPVSVLSDDEAWSLFREMAGGDVMNKPDINSIAKQVVKECGGLPLAIVTVGKALGNKKKHAWEDALQQLRKSQVTSFTDMQECVYSRIELSYNFLGSEQLKSFLLLCGLFPEDSDIPIEVLMRYGMGMGYFSNVGELWTARNRVHTLVGDLKGCFLLLDGDKEQCVKMHDVVRDFVIRIASKGEHGFMVRSDVEIREMLKSKTWDHVDAMSLMLGETEVLGNGLHCPQMKLLQVASKKRGIPWPENLFSGVSNLQVLGLENLCIPKMSSLFQTLNNLQTLRVENCHVGDISIIGMELARLEILSFARSDIRILPKEIGKLGSLRLLDLQGCTDLYKIHSNVFARLSLLEELYFGVDNFPWSQNNDALIELKNLSLQLKVFEISVQKVEYLPEELVVKNLIRFRITIGWARSRWFRKVDPNLKDLDIANVDYGSIKSSSILKQLVRECKVISLRDVKYLENVVCEIDEGRFPHVKDPSIDECSNLQCFLDCSTYSSAFPLLESLRLENLEKLKVICHVSSHRELEKSKMDFSNLMKLELYNLSSLIGFTLNESFQSQSQVEERSTSSSDDSTKAYNGKLFTSNCMQWFPKLETIKLFGCTSLEILFDFQEYSQSAGQVKSVSVFPQLKKVDIESLAKLRYVWGTVPRYVEGFGNMRFLKLHKCNSLRYVFTPAIVKALSQLEIIWIWACRQIEKLVGDNNDGEKETKETIFFAKLNSLWFQSLPNLLSICANSYDLVWPSLRRLYIRRCFKLNISSRLSKSYVKQEDNVGFSNSKQDSPTSVKWFLGCTPTAKLCKTSSKATSSKDHVPRSVQKLEVWSSCMPVLEELLIEDCHTINVLFPLEENCHSSIPPSLKIVKISDCDKLEAIIAKDMNSFTHGAFDEDQRRMISCEKIEDIVSKKETQAHVMSKTVFPTLEHLNLEGLRNLRAFCRGSFDLDFPSLQKVEIKDCINMEVFSHGSSHTPKLEDVTITLGEYSNEHIHMGDLNATIHRMKAFVALQESEIVRWREQDEGVRSYCIKEREMIVQDFDRLLKVVQFNDIGMFKRIEELTVSNCHSVVEVFESDATMTHCELQVMTLSCLQNLRHLCASGLESFEKLRFLEIRGCDNLESLFSPSMARSLVQLQQLEVWSCEKMEEIVTKESEGDNNNEATISLPKLSRLDLSYLPNFKRFCSGVKHLGLPSLVECNYKTCPQLTTFSSEIVTISKDSHVNAEPHKMRTQGDLNLAIYYINNFEKYKVELQKLETFRWIKQDQHLDGYIAMVTTLELESCEKLLDCVPCNMKHRFQHLKNLQVRHCGALKEVFESGASEGNSMMQYELENISLNSLPKLRHIWTNNDGGILSFGSLNALHISGCHDLKSVFPFSIARSLQKLQDIHVYDCDMIEEIVTITEKDENIITFPELSKLKLENLPNLKRFCSSNCNFELPYCESITLTSLPRLKHIDALKSVLSVSVSSSPPELRSLHVSNCQMMEEIFTTKDDEVSQEPEEHIIIFPKLHELKLQKLPRLNCFYAGSCHFESSWFGYQDIIIEECSKMETFCHGIVITPLGCKASINGTEYSSIEDLNQIIHVTTDNFKYVGTKDTKFPYHKSICIDNLY